jgi:hypothetical protein
MIGNKTDAGRRAFTKQDAALWVEQRGFIGYYETSMKVMDASVINEIFAKLA